MSIFQDFRNWLKRLKYVVADYVEFRNVCNKEFHNLDILKSRVAKLRIEMKESVQLIKDRTNVGVDVHFTKANHVIMVGQYKGVDYVQTFSIPQEDFEGLMGQLKRLARYGNIVRLDAPPAMRAIVEREVVK